MLETHVVDVKTLFDANSDEILDAALLHNCRHIVADESQSAIGLQELQKRKESARESACAGSTLDIFACRKGLLTGHNGSFPLAQTKLWTTVR